MSSRSLALFSVDPRTGLVAVLMSGRIGALTTSSEFVVGPGGDFMGVDYLDMFVLDSGALDVTERVARIVEPGETLDDAPDDESTGDRG